MEPTEADKLRPAEVAKLVGLSKASVLREIEAGEFEAFRVGPSQLHIRVTRASVLAYMERRRITTDIHPLAAGQAA